jgi:hypothetical protein
MFADFAHIIICGEPYCLPALQARRFQLVLEISVSRRPFGDDLLEDLISGCQHCKRQLSIRELKLERVKDRCTDLVSVGALL